MNRIYIIILIFTAIAVLGLILGPKLFAVIGQECYPLGKLSCNDANPQEMLICSGKAPSGTFGYGVWTSYKICDYPQICISGTVGQGATCGSDVGSVYKCSDTDGGRNYGMKGTTEVSGVTGILSVEDFCIDNSWLKEYACKADNTLGGDIYQCPYGCENGVCKNAPSTAEWCKDSDLGKNYGVKGTVTTSRGGNYVDGCSSDKILSEYYCDTNFDRAIIAYDCSKNNKICKDGQCVEQPVQQNITTQQVTTPKPICGNGIIESGEDCTTCPFDAGLCRPNYEEQQQQEETIQYDEKLQNITYCEPTTEPAICAKTSTQQIKQQWLGYPECRYESCSETMSRLNLSGQVKLNESADKFECVGAACGILESTTERIELSEEELTYIGIGIAVLIIIGGIILVLRKGR